MHFRNNVFGGKLPWAKQFWRWLTKGVVWRTILFGFLFVFLIGALWFYVAVVRTLPDLSDISHGFSQTTLITDRNGEVLYKLYDENREYVSYDNMSPHVVNAIIAAEDQDFWTNE